MKTQQLLIQISQLAFEVEKSIQGISGDDSRGDTDRICGLLDAKEYLRRAYWAIEGTPTEDNDTTIETARALRAEQNFLIDND